MSLSGVIAPVTPPPSLATKNGESTVKMLITAAGAYAVGRGWISQEWANDAVALAVTAGPLVWSYVSNLRVYRRYWAAVEAPAGMAVPPPSFTPQAATAATSSRTIMTIDEIVADAKGLLAKAESLFAAQPQALQTDEGALLKEAMVNLTPKLDAATAELATTASPTLGPAVAAFLADAVAKEEPAIEADLASDIAAANAKAAARRAALAPVKAAVAQ